MSFTITCYQNIQRTARNPDSVTGWVTRISSISSKPVYTIHLIWARPALYCLNHTDQAPFFRLIVDQEVQELNLLLLSIVVFNSSFNLTTLFSSSFSSSSILQMSTSSARYLGMIMLCDFHIFESF